MKQRIFTAIWGVALVAAVNILGGVPLKVFGIVVAVVGIYEFLSVYKIEKYMMYLSMLASIIFFIIPVDFSKKTFILFITLFLFAFIESFKNEVAAKSIVYSIFSFIYVLLPIFFLVSLYDFENGKKLIWLPYLVCWATDTFAYFIGITFGKRRVWSSISPKKSLEGFIGGMIGGIIAVWFYLSILCYAKFDFKVFITGLIAGGGLSVIAHTGDLFASMLKREQNKKDFGYILPGHGGILDRFDSLIMVAPVIYLLAKIGIF
ncbi:phosphatidate cytidylyltransferase [Caldicellulosiruptor saccharolyticus DSM 8903]|uniref:Phosphatidate cytidylyltransferase n=1 Tax=Caldicellulosiruptor saccharolyticus (strain ATCC 43494 / DSM 8903 / Tp8T 6331) TaxID=351627 RepID=A4XLZ7_CALS8|nr:phosphatidate cytidylyltransferase [Caldicellulosiruptor saccharolyticus]ABP67932.1 phosphatidate cytidylyltransferase [Caldicellulosiruptor saccharolyticus DSM 8903]